MNKRYGVAALVASVLGAAPALAGDAAVQADALAALRWHARVLLVVAADWNDPKLARQRATFEAMAAGARDRDLRLVESIGPSPAAQAIRQRFGIADDGFHALLIGKDGGDKLASDEPLGADQLFPLIDAMPMRQDEMRGRS